MKRITKCRECAAATKAEFGPYIRMGDSETPCSCGAKAIIWQLAHWYRKPDTFALEQMRATRRDAVELLTKAVAFLKSGWVQGHYALDRTGQQCSDESPDACAFCLGGAMHRAVGVMTRERYPSNVSTHSWDFRKRTELRARQAVTEVIREQGEYRTIARFNDHPSTTLEQIIEVLRSATTNLAAGA